MDLKSTSLRIGTAGWSIARDCASSFPDEGNGLARYSTQFRCAEINSSFHRSHRASTWLRWAAEVPEDFRFSAKLSKEITHKRKLAQCEDLIGPAVEEMRLLGTRLAVVLVQLPPSLAFDLPLAQGFFALLRSSWSGGLACEPRHPSWFEEEPDALLRDLGIARVAADPARCAAAAVPGGWRDLAYWRLHGSPVTYRSSYDDGRLEAYAAAMLQAREEGRDVWCIFDNTASSAATGDALKLKALTDPAPPLPAPPLPATHSRP
ncbi:MAG TPA: DUF72 domain-containing protein [Allosphingosinicella sp.]|nr:DUF72 domain-containing protein [Allosphingosinicella sp.]